MPSTHGIQNRLGVINCGSLERQKSPVSNSNAAGTKIRNERWAGWASDHPSRFPRRGGFSIPKSCFFRKRLLDPTRHIQANSFVEPYEQVHQPHISTCTCQRLISLAKRFAGMLMFSTARVSGAHWPCSFPVPSWRLLNAIDN